MLRNCSSSRYAAENVLQAATAQLFPLVLLPLDITSQHTIPFSTLIRPPTISEEEEEPTSIRSFLNAMLSRPRIILRAFGLMGDVFEMHDPLAAWFVIQHAEAGIAGTELRDGWETTRRDFVIERTGEWTKGMCVVDRRYANIIYNRFCE